MTILGINGGFRQGYQDVSACIVRDGMLIAAVEEERLSRIKFSAGRLPYLSLLSVLDIAKVNIQDVDVVAYHGSTWEAEIDTKLKAYFETNFGYAPRVERHHHHDCHAAGAFFYSGYEEALIVTMDNSGDGASAQVSIGRGDQLTLVKRYERPHSYGLFYSLISQYCGFVKDSDEYKLMGLTAYGNRHKYDFTWLLDFENDALKINTDYIIAPAPKAPSAHRDEMVFNEKFIERMQVGRRLPNAPIIDFYKDVAASAQQHLEQTALKLIAYFITQTGIRNICLSGGVALNCLMNQKIMNAPFVDRVFIQPSASDAGISVGAAWLSALQHGDVPKRAHHTFLGKEYTDEEIQNMLNVCHVVYEKIDDPASHAASDITAGKVIGWFQGRMEFGPRALGNRSILASPCIVDMRSVMNRKIKFRESFRPFGASVLEEDVADYFKGKMSHAPYMTLVYDVFDSAKSSIPAVVHEDGTCRIQTVSQSDNSLYHSLLSHIKGKSGHGVVLNTSFNLNHEPIVESPRQAIASFFASGIDVLYLHNYRITK
jgi:carbamoyltransferase